MKNAEDNYYYLFIYKYYIYPSDLSLQNTVQCRLHRIFIKSIKVEKKAYGLYKVVSGEQENVSCEHELETSVHKRKTFFFGSCRGAVG